MKGGTSALARQRIDTRLVERFTRAASTPGKRAERVFDLLDASTAMNARDGEIGLPQPVRDSPAGEQNLRRAVCRIAATAS